MQDRGNDVDMSVKYRLDKGQVGSRALTSKVGILKGIWACGYGVKSIHMKYECLQNLISIRHRTNTSRDRMIVLQCHVYFC